MDIVDLSDKTFVPSGDRFEDMETAFAGLSVLLGCAALFLGLLQLRRLRNTARSVPLDEPYELEAGLSEVNPSAVARVLILIRQASFVTNRSLEEGSEASVSHAGSAFCSH